MTVASRQITAEATKVVVIAFIGEASKTKVNVAP